MNKKQAKKMLKHQELHKKLLRLAIAPIFITCTLLVIAFALLHSNEIKNHHEINKHLIHSLFTKLPLADANTPQKQEQLAQILLGIDDFHSVTFINSNNAALQNFGLPFIGDIDNIVSNNDYLCEKNNCYFFYPLNSTTNTTVPNSVFGAIITTTQSQNTVANYRAIIIILVTAIICFIITSWLANQFKAALIKPLEDTRRGLQRFLDGDYSSPLPTGNGEIYNLLVKDINLLASQQKELQDNLQNNIEHSTEELRETLETVEIQNIELDIARKSALQASRVKSEFLANISHEIRTPLNGIIGFAELLKKTELSSQQDEYLETIDESAKGLLTIINDILDFSRLEIGKLTLEYKPVRIRQVIEDAVRLHSPSAHQKKLRLLTVIDHDIPEHLLGDPLRLKQVLNNLISNAIKFTESGHILINVRKEERENSQLSLKFRITDSGIGLSQEQQESLFDAFTQLDSSESRAYGGTGLGLAIAKGLVDRMNGEIGAESELGKGATFWFTSLLGRNPKAAQNQGYLTGTLSKANILVFDSNPLGRNEITHYLRGWGAGIFEATEFNSILTVADKATKNTTIHLAILDAQIDNSSFDKHRLLDVIETLNHTYTIPAIVLAPPSIQRQISPLLKATHTVSMLRPVLCNRLHQQVCEQLGIIITEPNFNSVINQPTVIKQKLKILAVDDNAANLRLVKELLKELNVESVCASSGMAALEALKTETFDLILMDIQMPGMDGLEATKLIRQREHKNNRTPVVALTAHAVNEQKSKLLLAGMDDYLTKPVGESEIRHIIERWVTRMEPAPTNTPTLSLSTPANIADTASSTDNSGTTPLVDLALSLSLTKNKPDLAKDMLQMLLDSLPEALQKIQEYSDEPLCEALQEEIHKLHGGACYCGIPLLKEASSRLDKQLQDTLNGKAPLPNDFKLQIELLDQLLSRLIEWQSKTNLDDFFGIATSNENA